VKSAVKIRLVVLSIAILIFAVRENGSPIYKKLEQ
jgi:hypothetical protein